MNELNECSLNDIQEKCTQKKEEKIIYQESSDENEKKIMFLFWRLYQESIQFYFEN